MNVEKLDGGLSALTDVLGCVLTYSTTGHNRPCGQTIGANGLGEYVVLITGDTVDAEQAAREYLRNLERNGYRITEAIIVTNEEAYSGKPISVMQATPNAALRGDSGLIAGVPLESTVMQQEEKHG